MRELALRAPAKVNLTLHVRARRADGYHELSSLVAFAGLADTVTLAPGPGLALTATGPTAPQAGPVGDNLILRAAAGLERRRPGLRMGHFTLVKRIPVAAGLGGGSSDAAAALRLLARLNGLAEDDPALMDAAEATGSDVPACLCPRMRMLEGRGERVGPPLDLPALPAILANPGLALPTPAVFAGLGLAIGAPGPSPAPAAPALGRDASPSGEAAWGGRIPGKAGDDGRARLLGAIASGRNDLEPPALARAPAIGAVLAALRGEPGCRLARMSGSGATCFALFDDRFATMRAARALSAAFPAWWIKPTWLR